MLSVIVGGAASGKSAYAENLVLSLEGPRVYVATMQPWDDECLARIGRHRARRASQGFRTLECYRNLASLDVDPGSNVLLDCVGNLLANELYAPDVTDYAAAAERVANSIVTGVRHVAAASANLTVVTNEVGMAGVRYEGQTLPYLMALALVNRTIAAKADFVCEVVAGLPNVLRDARAVPCAH